MLIYLTGVPGSGKTYYAAYRIYKSENVVYTNIMLSSDYPDVFKINFSFADIVINRLFFIYKKYQNSNKLDYILNKYFSYVGIKKHTLFVIDEAHNFLRKSNESYLFFLSYHRHFFIDIILITQDLNLIHRDFLNLGELFYKSYSSTLNPFVLTHFTYRVYASSRMLEKVKTEKLKKQNKIFQMYHSGDVVNTEKRLFKMLLLPFFLFFLAILAFYYFYYSLSSQTPKHSSVTKYSRVSRHSSVTKYSRVSRHSFIFSCPRNYIFFVCYNNYCYYKGRFFSLTYLLLKYKKRLFFKNNYLVLKGNLDEQHFYKNHSFSYSSF